MADIQTLPRHGAQALERVKVTSYNLEIEDKDGFIGDRARRGAFWDALDELRQHMKAGGQDPLGKEPTADLGKKQLDDILKNGSAEAAGLVQGAIEAYAQQLSAVLQRFLKDKAWRGVECVAIGGGFRNSRIGEIAIGRAAVMLAADGLKVELKPIEHHPDEAGLIGGVHLLPRWMMKGHDAILAVDIGGSNIRAGVVKLGRNKDNSDAAVWKSELWRHAEDKVARTATVETLVDMLRDLAKIAGKSDMKIAPLVAIGCPGVIDGDGSILRGAQNLPGNWEGSRFNLPAAVQKGLETIDGQPAIIVMHNDAVVQGLSHLPAASKCKSWAVLTIGTGLGNASYETLEGGG